MEFGWGIIVEVSVFFVMVFFRKQSLESFSKLKIPKLDDEQG